MGNFILVDDAFVTRAMWGILIAAGIAAVARRYRTLTTGGAVAAAAVGAITIAAGWSWAVLLLAFFVSSTMLSRWRREEKEAGTGGVLAKDDERDAVQVLANGAIFAAAALLFKARWLLTRDVFDEDPTWTISWMVFGAGALSAACADTWSTEVGTLAPAAPRLITTRREVPPGTSGGITGAGLTAGACGALFMALLVRIVHWPWAIALAAGVGGIAGTLADSLLGATLQGRRRCPKCGVATEREVHDCGTETEEAGGIAWLDNDAVNALSTGVGALAAFGIWRLLT